MLLLIHVSAPLVPPKKLIFWPHFLIWYNVHARLSHIRKMMKCLHGVFQSCLALIDFNIQWIIIANRAVCWWLTNFWGNELFCRLCFLNKVLFLILKNAHYTHNNCTTDLRWTIWELVICHFLPLPICLLFNSFFSPGLHGFISTLPSTKNEKKNANWK